MSRRRELTGDERALWRRVARTVKSKRPLPAEDSQSVPEPAKAVRAPSAKKAAAPAAARPKPPLAAPLADRGGEKRVRRGALEIDASIDLHGMTQDRARAAVEGFLADSQAQGCRVVLIVTGKGRAGEGGVLKRRLPDWLAGRLARPLVAGFAQAHARHGGGGAVYVFLKRPV